MPKTLVGLGLVTIFGFTPAALAAAREFEGVGLTPQEVFLAAVIAAMAACALTSFFLAGQVSERTHVALAMLIALIGGFGLLTLLAPAGRKIPIVGAVIVLALISLFKLMNQFEIRRKPRHPRS